MKTNIRLRLLLALLAASAQCAFGASVIFDSFSEGGFHLQNGGDNTHQTSISSPLLLDTRSVYSSGNGTWSVILAPGSGVLDYNVGEVLSTTRFGLTLDYTRGTYGQGWSLLGYDALVFDFTSVTGEGLLAIFVNDQNADEMVRRSVTTPGQLIYPLEDLAASNLGSISGMSISFTPQTDAFSFSLNEIAAVPEPSVSVMLLALAALIAGRRVRRR
jgi:hypothetical protein